MHSYLGLVEDCDRLPEYPKESYTFYIDGYSQPFGHVVEDVVQKMPWTADWNIDHGTRTIVLQGSSTEIRSQRMNHLLTAARDQKTFSILSKWSNEIVPIYGPKRQVALKIERFAALLFGFVSYGVELVVYREDEQGLQLWLSRRSPKKLLYPNKLSVTVGGGLPVGETPSECVVREAKEEADLDANVLDKAIAVGTAKYVTVTDSRTMRGADSGLIRAELHFLYELKVGPEVVPRPADMEASEIELYTVDEVQRALDNGEFTPANACFVLLFLIRHGIVTFENEPKYTQITTRLSRSLGVYSA